MVPAGKPRNIRVNPARARVRGRYLYRSPLRLHVTRNLASLSE